MNWMKCLSLCAMMAMLAVVAGCGGGGDFGKVSGTVTLNGEPLSGARVVFQFVPEEDAGQDEENITSEGVESVPAEGITDDSGYYELETNINQPGAMVGTHGVSIWHRERQDEIPKKWMEGREETRKVEPGSNTFDFDIVTEEGSSEE